MSRPELLIAGIGNVFFGDDGFGVEVVRQLARCSLPETVRVLDFGIRGFDLACALVDGYQAAILIDTTSRDGPPGTLYTLELDAPEEPAVDLQPHSLEPAKVLALARSLGDVCPWLRLVGCEPLTFGTEDEPIMGLSPTVLAAVPEAVRLVERMARNYLDEAPGKRRH